MQGNSEQRKRESKINALGPKRDEMVLLNRMCVVVYQVMF
jgi:hypothetical protein